MYIFVLEKLLVQDNEANKGENKKFRRIVGRKLCRSNNEKEIERLFKNVVTNQCWS